ncbi:hypothetical protein [Pimelobacter simplex]|uniref:hypothetical protein n=1 Tax=Nocardioides simplex TaxID=2045 RepID=UPI0021503DC5|nr:hypothetical protein [Pimelobacter simplex]UUW90880.1 hypothetical protein M0M43_05160 [Pimelobacter simplex]UUW94709.1 hypothetical protein M0M48_23665 [Pimelobacter simplex]
MRRRPAPLLARALVLVAALAAGGCGDGEDDGRSAEPAGVLSVDQIEDILLPVGATVGDATVNRKAGINFIDDRRASPESCQPLSSIIRLEPHPVHSDRVEASPRWISPYGDVQVLTYAGDDAAKVFAAVDRAIDDCANGFAAELIRRYVVLDVVRDTAPPLGDEALAFGLRTHEIDEEEPIDEHEHRVLVRDGQHLLSWRTTGLEDDGAVEARDLLTAFVDAQWARYAERR